jgi:hypothetical protein
MIEYLPLYLYTVDMTLTFIPTHVTKVLLIGMFKKLFKKTDKLYEKMKGKDIENSENFMASIH